MTQEQFVSDTEKTRIATHLIQEAPPGEFNEVWNDIRILLNDDALMGHCTPAAAQYNKDQLLAVQYDSSSPAKTLLTNYNELPEGRFFDPISKKSFKYNFLTKTASDVQPYEGPHVDEKLEAFRKAVQVELDAYIQEHYHNGGLGVVFIFNGHLAIAIESHIFKPKSFWNGRWRSQWEIPGLDKHETIDINGISRINVHYYEDGNVQLSTKKDLTAQAKYSNDPVDTAKNVISAIEKAETVFENAILQNYEVMSDNTFKLLRRKLPITKHKFDWQNIHSYRIAHEIKPQ
ncbi:F-actin-capping protein subunit alpha [Aphelenchoides bicaudatus]|nr:F-actin-capping protein subunit alpha [Aphelenchoides bicaudatus]